MGVSVQYEMVAKDALDEALVKIAEEMIPLYRAAGWWKEGISRAHDLPAMIRGSFTFMVARSAQGRMVGMGRVISDGVSDGYIQDVTVSPEFRGQGIGAEIVRRLANDAASRRLEWIALVAEPGTRPFYEKLGFKALEQYQPMLYSR